VRIIAEDLGDFDVESRAGLDTLMEQFGFPGMKIVQFAFASTPQDPFLPHNFTRSWVAYTGTHDNDTAAGWWANSSTETERAYAKKYLRSNGTDIPWDIIRAAWGSVANTAMTTAQDLLSLGSEARLNFPGKSGPPNWCWRLGQGELTDQVAARLNDLTFTFGRLNLGDALDAPLPGEAS
jgi:4-alpha-glucanotransferase